MKHLTGEILMKKDENWHKCWLKGRNQQKKEVLQVVII